VPQDYAVVTPGGPAGGVLDGVAFGATRAGATYSFRPPTADLR